MIEYPSIDPTIVSFGRLSAHWYGLMYVIGFAIAWWLARRRARSAQSSWTRSDVDDLIFASAVGVLLGGRLGWLLFYGTERLLVDPLLAFRMWEGGMSFHGGLLGVLGAIVVFARRHRRAPIEVCDFLAPLVGPGILAGRIGNFINGELWGKPTQLPWGFAIDPAKLHATQAAEAMRMCARFHVDPCVLHVHASQLYEGLLEGGVLFLILWVYSARPRPRSATTALFLLMYGAFRFALEFVRVPDENRGYLFLHWVTMGQLLSAPMILAGAVLLVTAYRRHQSDQHATHCSAAAASVRAGSQEV